MIYSIFFIFLVVVALVCVVGIATADFRRRIIPDAYLFPLMLTGLLLLAFYPYPISLPAAAIGGAFGYALSATVGFVFDYFLRRRTPDAISPIGMGDIKLIGVGGIWLGTTGLAIALVVACLTGAIWARVKNQHYIPFAPFFLLGGILALIGIAFLL